MLTVPAASGKAAPNHLPDNPFTIPDNALHSATATYTSNEPDGSTSTDTDTYDAKGRSIAATHKLTAADGTIRQWATESNEYNDAGQLVVEKQLQDPDGDGPIAPSSWITTTSYDKSGYATTKVTTFDKFSDGNQVTVSTVTFGRTARAACSPVGSTTTPTTTAPWTTPTPPRPPMTPRGGRCATSP